MSKSENFEKSINQNVAFTSKRLFDLFLLINEQAAVLYEDLGIRFPVNVSSTVLYLSVNKEGSLTEIARGLGLSHQLISQRVKILQKLNLINKKPAENDKRKTLYFLTEEGIEQSRILDQYCVGAEQAFNNLSEDLGVDLHAVLNTAVNSLRDRTFAERYEESISI